MADPLATHGLSTYRVVADDGRQRWCFHFEADDRSEAVAAITTAVRVEGLPEQAGAAMRRHVAWTALPGVLVEPKPVRIAGTTVTIFRDALAAS
jgi:hypothetical protein